ncbi:MAG TPA: YibE/F family protein [Actinomycetes bacterium]|jgi:uncharacterized membrane protein
MRSTTGRYRAMLAVVGVIALAVLAGVVALWPRGELARPAGAGQDDSTRFVSATLTKVTPLDCEEADPGVPGSICIKATARLADGRPVSFDTTDPTGGMFRAGQRVSLAVTEQPGQPPTYLIQDLERGRPMLILVALFVGAVIAFGRWQGIRSLIGLGLSFLVIVGFVVPSILRGHSPVAVALTGAMAIMLLSLYLSHGIGPKTTAAVVGTALALGLTAALSIVFVAATSLTGLASEEAQFASFAVGGLSLRGLLLAGIIIGGLGVLDDVTMSQASLVTELHQANPTAGMAALVAGALRVGRDHIAATVNTLFLAYAGAALPTLILFVTAGQNSLSTVATTEIVAVEIVRALCGSVGLIAAVPLTTVLAALVATEEPQPGFARATAPGAHTREAEPAGPADTTGPQGRSGWGLTRGLRQEQAGLVLDRVLAVHGPQLSHAVVDVDSGGWLATEELPVTAKAAAARLRQLAADAQRGASRLQRARTRGLVRLDLTQPEQLDLLRRFGPFATDARVWVQGDPTPVIETGDSFGDLPRFTYRLDQPELDQVQTLLAKAGLAGSTLVPRRLRPAKT